MSFQLERLGTFLKPNPDHAWEAGGAFNPGLFREPGQEDIIFTYRGVPVSGFSTGDFSHGKYLSSVGHGTLRVDPQNRTYAVTNRADVPWLSVAANHPNYPHVNGMGYEDGSRLGQVRTSRGNVYVLPHTEVGVSADGKGIVRAGLATTKDLATSTWDIHGPIGPDTPSKAVTIFQVGDGEHVGMFMTLDPDTRHSAIYYAGFANLNELLHPPQHFWENFSENRDAHIVEALRPSSQAHRGPEIGGGPIRVPLESGREGLLVALAPESFEERWDISYVLFDAGDPRQVVAQTDIVLRAETAEETAGPICRNCAFPGSPVVIGSETGERMILQPHGQGDIYGALAIGSFDELVGALGG